MRTAKLFRYQLPMDSGVILRDARLEQRIGYIVQLEQNGKIGFGEVAPLHGFSVESHQEAGMQAQQCIESWLQGHEFDYNSLFPSVAFGLSMANLELTDAMPQQGQYQCAPLCTGDPDALIPLLANLEGEKIAKVKVGNYEPSRDGLIVTLLLQAIPDLKLRLDANRVWTADIARQFAKHVPPSLRQRIEFVEEPCLNPGDSLAFAIDTGIAIAWDETLQQAVREDDFSLSSLNGGKAIIIKPTLIGSVDRCIALIKRADELGIKPVISSSLESSLGLNQLARFSRWLIPDSLPGLDTVNLFQSQLEVAWPGCELPVESLMSQELVWQS